MGKVKKRYFLHFFPNLTKKLLFLFSQTKITFLFEKNDFKVPDQNCPRKRRFWPKASFFFNCKNRLHFTISRVFTDMVHVLNDFFCPFLSFFHEFVCFPEISDPQKKAEKLKK
jgi:hypothetical protein